MPVRVLVVDDSALFRRQFATFLSQDQELEIIGTAVNGEQAVRKAADLRPDIITMDIQMPVMDGITAVKHIMTEHPTPIVMLSVSTRRGARSSMDALEAGAVDVMLKPQRDELRDSAFSSRFIQRLKVLGKNKTPRKGPGGVAHIREKLDPAPARDGNHSQLKSKDLDVVVIGSSTGGPAVAQQILAALPADFKVPVVLVQHMPASFMQSFAERLNRLCPLEVLHSKDGDILKPGCVYVVPGGVHTEINGRRGILMLNNRPKSTDECYCPSVDFAFTSASQSCPGRVLGIVFTGMGSDGCIGAKALKASSSTVWTQSKESCTIYGMPRAIIEAGLADRVLDLPGFCKALQEL